VRKEEERRGDRRGVFPERETCAWTRGNGRRKGDVGSSRTPAIGYKEREVTFGRGEKETRRVSDGPDEKYSELTPRKERILGVDRLIQDLAHKGGGERGEEQRGGEKEKKDRPVLPTNGGNDWNRRRVKFQTLAKSSPAGKESG